MQAKHKMATPSMKSPPYSPSSDREIEGLMLQSLSFALIRFVSLDKKLSLSTQMYAKEQQIAVKGSQQQKKKGKQIKKQKQNQTKTKQKR